MPRLKRPRDEVDLDTPNETDVESDNYELLKELRNMWEFASLMQYIFLFGEVVKIDNDFDIEDLEAECLKSTPSEKLAEIGLALLKLVSSHRGLNLEIFEEYARRQYLAKAPRRNPFGDEEEPKKFNDLDIFTRIRIMHQLSTWTLGNADRIRAMMPGDEDPIHWRMEPLGWDKEDRAYFVLDDNRLYRRTDETPPPPSPKPKEKRKPPPRRSSARATRASKRRRIDDSEEEEEEDDIEERQSDEEGATTAVGQTNAESEDESEWGFGFTSKTWECVAVTLDDYQEFMSTIFRSRNPNEKLLRASIEADILPIIEKRAEVLKQKQLRKMREFENLQKLATAKRSSRLADKAEKEKQEREEREAEEKRQRDIQMALDERERQKRVEEGHESRRLTREQRLRERESKRILLEEELAKLDETDSRNDSEEPNDDKARRISNRQIQTQKAQHTMELEMLAEEENEWVFDCSVCGINGGNLDDGTHSIACDRCNVWQHSKCHGLTKQQAEHNDFRFVCAACKQKEVDAKKPKIPPLKLAKTPSQDDANKTATASNGQRSSGVPEYVQRQLDGVHIPGYPDLRSAGPFGQLTGHPPSQNGISPPPLVKSPHQAHPYQNFAPQPPPPPPPNNYQPPAAHHYQSPPTHNYQSPTGQFVQPQVSPRPNSSHGWPSNPAPMHQQPPPHWQPNSRPPSGNAGSPPPPMNGYGMGPAGPPMPMNGYPPAPPAPPPPPPPPPYHQQNHQYSHNSAVASTPGHMVYVSQHYGPEPPVPPPGMYVVAHTTVSPYGYPPPMPYQMPPYPQPPQEPPRNQGNSQKGPGPSQKLMVYEPKKKRSSSPGTMRVRPWVPKIRKGPETSPRATRSSQSNAQASSSSEEAETLESPSKPSENPVTSQSSMNSSSPHNDPPRLMTPQQNSTQVLALTPQNPSDGQAPPSSTSKLAEDGMSGPWPESSKNIPQKHDQRPAPPLPPQSSSSSSQGLEGVGIYPPNTPLAPSPRSQEAAKMGTIPVKKTPAPQQVTGASKGKEPASQTSKRVVARAD